MKENATYVKEAVCSCGYRLLKDEVPLRKRYRVIDLGDTGWLVCGGCGKKTAVKLVVVVEDTSTGMMPMEIFELDGEEKV